MTLLTLDKAIDSPRYITFQSIKGNEIKFIYPNLFKVEVYKKDQNNNNIKTEEKSLNKNDINNNNNEEMSISSSSSGISLTLF